MYISRQLSDQIWILKGLAILSVFFAHMPAKETSLFNYQLFGYLGIIGVPIFFFFSGFFDYYSKTSNKEKIKRLFIPLFIWGSLTFFINIFIGNFVLEFPFCVIAYFKWILGLGTWYFFVPVLIVCILLCKYINPYLLIGISIISIVLCQFKIIPYNSVFTYHINPFNFIIYFVLGRLVRQWNLLPTIQKWYFNIIGIVLIIIAYCFGGWGLKQMPIYFNLLCIPFSIGVFLLLFNITLNFRIHLLIDIGRCSFVMYLMHMQLAGFINGHCSFLSNTPFEFIKVLIAYVCVFGCVYVLRYILSKLQLNTTLVFWGYR